ncbi:MAG TPA: AIR synthase-related protein, partial [Thermoleophilaceae bacterium]|nr:AIR synthase-related protein [Thermoleophilaceae bacterium]
EMHEVFNMGCGFCCVVPTRHADAAVEILSEHHAGATVIGHAIERPGVVELPCAGLIGGEGGFTAN